MAAPDISTLPGAEQVNWVAGETEPVPIWSLVNRHFTQYEKKARGRMMEYEATLTIAVTDVPVVNPADDDVEFDGLVWDVDSYRLTSFKDYYMVEVSSRKSVDERVE